MSKQVFLEHMNIMVRHGRDDSSNFREMMDFWGHMCLGESGRTCEKGIMSSSTNYQKNFHIEGKRRLTGKNIADFIGISDEAFIRLGLENYLFKFDDSWEFADNPKHNKFTKKSEVGKAGSWPQEGLD